MTVRLFSMLPVAANECSSVDPTNGRRYIESERAIELKSSIEYLQSGSCIRAMAGVQLSGGGSKSQVRESRNSYV